MKRDGLGLLAATAPTLTVAAVVAVADPFRLRRNCGIFCGVPPELRGDPRVGVVGRLGSLRGGGARPRPDPDDILS